MALISPRGARRPPDGPGPADRRRPLGPRPARRRAREAYAAGHLPGAIFSTSTTTWPIRRLRAPGRHPAPLPGRFAAALARPGSAIGHVRRRLRRRRRLGRGAAVVDARRTSATRGWRSSTAASRRGSRRACRSTTEVPRSRRRAPPRDGVDRRHRSRRAPGAARLGGPARRPRRAALSRRDRADRPGRRPHPDRPQRARPTATSPTGGRFLRPRSSRRGSRPSAPTARRGRSSRRAAAASRRCTTRSRCASAGLPDPILYVGSYSDWSRSGDPVATGPSRATRRSNPQVIPA